MNSKSKINDIYFWSSKDKYAFLSNFYSSPITIDEKFYSTVENYYQASKTLVRREHEMVRLLEKPLEAKLAGYHITLRRGWDDIKDEIMLRGS